MFEPRHFSRGFVQPWCQRRGIVALPFLPYGGRLFDRGASQHQPLHRLFGTTIVFSVTDRPRPMALIADGVELSVRLFLEGQRFGERYRVQLPNHYEERGFSRFK